MTFQTIECYLIEKQNNLLMRDNKNLAQKKIDIGGRIVDLESKTLIFKDKPDIQFELIRSKRNTKMRSPINYRDYFIDFEMPKKKVQPQDSD